jgi:quaternary ammonium compound-resistance protein SugE
VPCLGDHVYPGSQTDDQRQGDEVRLVVRVCAVVVVRDIGTVSIARGAGTAYTPAMSASWIALVVAGLLEVCWAIGLKYTDGFRRPIPSALVIVAIAASMFLLSWAARTLPIGTAYAVWVGIGALGAAILGIILFHEPLTAARMGFLLLLLISIVGLKVTN